MIKQVEALVKLDFGKQMEFLWIVLVFCFGFFVFFFASRYPGLLGHKNQPRHPFLFSLMCQFLSIVLVLVP